MTAKSNSRNSSRNDEIVDNMIRDIFLSGGMLRSTFSHIHDHIHEGINERKEFSLPRSHYILLAVLKEKKTATMSEICNILYISKPNLTSIIDSLIERKLVKREYDKKDRRIIRIQITEKGEETMKMKKIFIKNELKSIFEKLNEKDMDNLYKSFKNIKEILSKIK
jgi:DNA-binding MarR family transcriptional regulator